MCIINKFLRVILNCVKRELARNRPLFIFTMKKMRKK